MNEKKKKGRPAEGEDTFIVGSKSTASATDCTGLMQTPADTEEEMESYSDIYIVPVPRDGYPYEKEQDESCFQPKDIKPNP